jgi:hypothetical protein
MVREHTSRWSSSARVVPLLGAAILAGVCLGCTGAIGSGHPGGGPSQPGGGGQPGVTEPPGPGGGSVGPGGGGGPALPPAAPASAGRLRLLTRSQLENTLRDLLGDLTLAPTEADTPAEGFASIGASYNAISPRGVEQYEAALLAALKPLFAEPSRSAALVGCTPGGPDDEACLRRFVTGFGRRAWRRPLTVAEADRYVELARGAAGTLKDVQAGLMHTTSALLASPHFLYRVELGQPAAGGRYRYTGWEMASRLSYLLWNTTPDSQLLSAAESGKLDGADGVRAEVTRLLASPRARSGFADNFGRELVGLDALAETPKDDPRFTPGLRAAMAGEVMRLFESRLDAGADAMDLYDGSGTFVNAELAALYGISGITGTALVPAALPPKIPRAGLLGTAAFLSLQSKQDATSPTGRGKFVREALLCDEVPDPPDNLDTTLKEPPPGAKPTLREHLEMHRSSPACAACHAIIDPIGFAFESFDWIGAYRDRDNGKPVDTSGTAEGISFADARGLVAGLRKLPRSQDCLLRNIFRYASGHRETEGDAPELERWRKSFEAHGHQLAGFLAEIAAGDGFRTVSPAP